MSEIAEFLRARYAERQALAEAARDGDKGCWTQEDPGRYPGRIVDERGETVVYDEGAPTEEQGTHIAANDPAFVIADCDTKLALVDEHPEVNDGDCGTCVQGSWGYPTHGGSTPTTFPCRTLRLLAQPFAGHPDHKGEEWTP